MYSFIREYLDLVIAAFNTTVSTDLVETTASLDLDKLPATQSNGYYQIRIKDYSRKDNESRITYAVNVEIGLTFGIYKQNKSQYQSIIDTYIHPLTRLIKSSYTSGSMSISNIYDIQITGLEEIVKGNYLQPVIAFKVDVNDGTDITLSVPSAPTLTSPTDGSTSGATNQAFNWTGTADTWEIEISTGGSVVIQQEGLIVSSFTVPADSLLTNGSTYSWRVRGTNDAGTGAWSSAFTFTVNDTTIVGKTPLEVGLTDIWVRGDDITLSSGAVASWNDKSGNARHLTNATTGNRPITETINGKTFVKFEGSFTAVRNLSIVDSAHLFKLTGTQVRTFAFVVKIGANTTGKYNSIFARTNNNVGDEYFLRMPTNFGSAPSYNYFSFPKSDATLNEIVMPDNQGSVHLVVLEVSSTACKIFIDGSLIAVRNVTFQTAVTLPANASTLFVLGGARQPNATQGTFNGSIGEFASGNVALTTTQVAQLYKYYQDYYGV